MLVELKTLKLTVNCLSLISFESRTGPALEHRPRVQGPRAHAGKGPIFFKVGVNIDIFGFWGYI